MVLSRKFIAITVVALTSLVMVGTSGASIPTAKQVQKDNGDWVGPLGPHSGNVFAH